jgi:anti-sigma regulatory factor (Ser/Thr protein kinase)
MRWRKVYRGDERQLAALRRWLRSLLPEIAPRDDVISAATELATNAIKHTASGRDGWFTVEIIWHGSVVRLAVADGGAPHGPRVIDDPGDPWGEHGRGLKLVRRLAARTGVSGDHCCQRHPKIDPPAASEN